MNNNSISVEAELVSRIGDGDQDAENEFLDLYYDYVKGATRRRVNPNDVDDIAQLVMWAACIALRNKKYEGRSTLKQWLAVIVKNKAMQHHRYQYRHPTVESDLDIQSCLARQDLQTMIDEAISLLTPKQRLIFLKHEHGMTIEQIAQSEKIPMGTVGRVLAEAKKRLQKILVGSKKF